MTGKSEQVLIKTPQGVNATRSGVGLSPQAYAMLKLFDSAMPVAGFKSVCKGAAMSDAAFQSTLDELLKFDHLRMVDAGATAGDAQARAAERRMLLTLDFTVDDVTQAAKPEPPSAPRSTAMPATSAQAARAPASAPAPSMPPAANEDAAREERAVTLKREAEIRQKLLATLQPQVEEELRARLRPKLEQELRPKLITALRPGIEAEVRTALTKELAPRIELELKARFAKSMAAQKAADEQAAPPPPPVPAAPQPVVDEATTRLMASLGTPLFTLDKTGVCNYMSPAWAQFTGFDCKEVVGRHLANFFADRDQRAVTSMLTGIVNGTALRFEQQGEVKHKDGHGLWVEVSAAPLTAANGETIGVCGSLRDAAELRRVTEQAEGDSLRLLLLVEQIDTGVILEDRDGNIQQANPALCALLSLDAAPYSLEGMPVAEVFEMASRGFIGPDGFLRRVAEVRTAGEDAKGDSYVMVDGRVLEQDYLKVTSGETTVGHLWLFREMRRTRARVVS